MMQRGFTAKRVLCGILMIVIVLMVAVCIFLWLPRTMPIDEAHFTDISVTTTDEGSFLVLEGEMSANARRYSGYSVECKKDTMYITLNGMIPCPVFGIDGPSIFSIPFSWWINIRIRLDDYPPMNEAYLRDNVGEQLIYSFLTTEQNAIAP